MNKNQFLVITEIILIVITMILAIQWICNPQGNYEPWTVLGGTILAILEILRQKQKTKYSIEFEKFNEKLHIEPKNLFTDSKNITIPGLLRYILDQHFPGIHTWLTNRIVFFKQPTEWQVLHDYLCTFHATIANQIHEKTFVEPPVKALPERANLVKSKRTGFFTPIQQVIKEILGVSQGGDAQNAYISAISKKSKLVKNIVKRLLRANEPLILLGDPGSGKTLTLQQAAMLIAEKESKRLFPKVCLFIHLGDFQVSGDFNSKTVWEFIEKSTPVEIRPFLESLHSHGRLVIFFDGMDEMSRERYNEHTIALSIFAGSRKGVTKTLFSCRVTDFTPRFQHNRLVLLPFNRRHIYLYIKQQIPYFPIKVGDRYWSAKKLAKRLSEGGLSIQTDNPFVLWLLCTYIQEEQNWPQSRVQLLNYYNRLNYQRKVNELSQTVEQQNNMNRIFLIWGRIAYEITIRNKGVTIPIEEVNKILDTEELPAIQAGIHCGILQKSLDLEIALIKFEHHRFQEYFNALYLNNNNSNKLALIWLDKLDAPRWQETIFNLVLMGGGHEALNALSNAIAQELSILKDNREEEKRPEFYQIETDLADRVELASRILQQIPQKDDEIFDQLFKVFRDAVYWLSENGNPITKVKMLYASRLVTGIDIYKVVRDSLESKISWVQEQALIIASIISEKGGRGGIQEKVLNSYASGNFLNYFPGYIRVASALKQRRIWSTLVIGLVLSIFQLFAGYGMVLKARSIIVPALIVAEDARLGFVRKTILNSEEKDKESKLVNQEEYHEQLKNIIFNAQKYLDSRWYTIFITISMVLFLFYLLRRAPGKHVLGILGIGYVLIILPFLVCFLHFGYSFYLLFIVLIVLVLYGLIFSLVTWALFFFLHIFTLQLFKSIVFFREERIRNTPQLFQLLWEICGYRIIGVTLFKCVFCTLIIFIIYICIITIFNWKTFLINFSLFPFLPNIINALFSIAIYAQGIEFVTIILFLFKRKSKDKIIQQIKNWTFWCITLFIGIPLSIFIAYAAGGILFYLLGLIFRLIFNILIFTEKTLCLFPKLPFLINFLISFGIYAVIICLVLFILFELKEKKINIRELFKIFKLSILIFIISPFSYLFMCVLSIAVLSLLGFLIFNLVNWQSIWKLIGPNFSMFPFLPGLTNNIFSIIIYLEIIGCVTGIILFIKSKVKKFEKSLYFFIIWTFYCILMSVITFLGWALYETSNYLVRLILLIILMASIVLFIISIINFSRHMIPLLIKLIGQFKHPQHSSEAWKNKLQKLNSDYQAMYLKRTTPETLEISINDFLQLLIEVESYVQHEPALSAYWAKRYEIEQIIRQERIG